MSQDNQNHSNEHNDTWTIGRAFAWIQSYLEKNDNPSIRSSAQKSTQSLLMKACGLSRIDLYTHFQQIISGEQLHDLHNMLVRRASGEPIQYVVNTAPFRYIDVKVNPGVLIPRPETEVLVSELINQLPPLKSRVARDSLLSEYEGAQLLEDMRAREAANNEGIMPEGAASNAGPVHENAVSNAGPVHEDAVKNATTMPEGVANNESPTFDCCATPLSAQEDSILLVADICTGSGCIACALASERPDVRVIASDISEDAVALACENVCDLNLQQQVRVLQGDLGQPIAQKFPQYMGKFHAIISNPPYIPQQVYQNLVSEVLDWEPKLALCGGEDGLDVFRALLPWAYEALCSHGVLAIELYEKSLSDAVHLAREAGFTQAHIVNDLTGRPRVLSARKK